MADLYLLTHSQVYGKLIVIHHMGNLKKNNNGVYFVKFTVFISARVVWNLNQNICSSKSSEPDTLIFFFFHHETGLQICSIFRVHLAMKTLVILVFWRYFDTIDKYCIANIIYLIGDTSNYGLSSIFLLCTQKNFRWLYAVGFALSLKHWWFYQSNPVLLYGLSRTERTVRWTSSQGPVIETSQLFQCIFEIKTMLGFIIISSLLDIDMM